MGKSNAVVCARNWSICRPPRGSPAATFAYLGPRRFVQQLLWHQVESDFSRPALQISAYLRGDRGLARFGQPISDTGSRSWAARPVALVTQTLFEPISELICVQHLAQALSKRRPMRHGIGWGLLALCIPDV